MRKLFLYANYLATQEDQRTLTLEYIFKAYNSIAIDNNKLSMKLVDFFKWYVDIDMFDISIIQEEKYKSTLAMEEYEVARKTPMNAYESDIVPLLDTMFEFGYSDNTDNIKVSIDILTRSKKVKSDLCKTIFGQDKAIDSVVDGIMNNIIPSNNMPKATYFFLGPPATGKTYLAKQLGESLEEYELKYFDMTQYTNKDSGGALYGTSRMWGNASVGALTSAVKNNPKTLVILDEFEKADNAVQSNLLTIFSEGYLIDACGWCQVDDKELPYNSLSSKNNKEVKCDIKDITDKVDFTQAIFIITSNLGKSLYLNNNFLELIKSNHSKAETMILENISQETKKLGTKEIEAISPEFLSRLSQGHIVLFNKLDYNGYKTIATESLAQYIDRFNDIYGLYVSNTMDKQLYKVLTLSYAPNIDVRRMKNKIGQDFMDIFTDYFLEKEYDIEYYEYIDIRFSSKSLKYIEKHIDPLIANNTIVNTMFRKNLTLDYTYTLKDNKDGVIIFEFTKIKLIKVHKSDDFSDNGLVFDIPDVSFNDIAGHIRAKERLSEVINFLKNPELLMSFNIKPPKGMLLYGSPGTGKTMLAKALANEADLPFLQTTGSELLDIKSMDKIFYKAKEYAPSIIFIDEIDAIGNREENQNRNIFINKLLSHLDGFSNDPNEQVFVIAATNYKDNIDPAIIRAGRIELHIHIDKLDKESRRYFLAKIIQEKPFYGNYDIEKLLLYTAGMNGSQFDQLSRESSIYCLRNKIDKLNEEILIEQINIIKYGEKLTNESIENMIQETAIHEAGHAVISKILIPHRKIEQITITPRTNSLGFVSYDQDNSQANKSLKEFKEEICVSLAGRLAQIKKDGNNEGIDTGASSDLEHATKLAYLATAYYGMNENIGFINTEALPNKHMFDIEVKKGIEDWMKKATKATKKLIDVHWDKIENLSNILIEKEVVYESELMEIVSNNQ